MRIAIVGANSYVARNLVFYLSSSVDEILLYDYNESFVGKLDKKTNYHQIDFNSLDSISSIDFGVDVIYFFTGLTGPRKSVENYSAFITVNEIYLLNFLNSYKNNNSRALIVYPSSRLIYCSSSELIPEEGKKAFNSVYAINKYAAENYIKLFHKLYDVQYCIFRIGVPFGTLLENCTSYGTYELFIEQAKNNKAITLFGNGRSLRTFTAIEDICYVLSACLKEERLRNHTFNIGGHSMTLYDLAVIISGKYNADIKYVEWPEFDNKIEVINSALDSAKLDKILNYKYKRIV